MIFPLGYNFVQPDNYTYTAPTIFVHNTDSVKFRLYLDWVGLGNMIYLFIVFNCTYKKSKHTQFHRHWYQKKKGRNTFSASVGARFQLPSEANPDPMAGFKEDLVRSLGLADHGALLLVMYTFLNTGFGNHSAWLSFGFVKRKWQNRAESIISLSCQQGRGFWDRQRSIKFPQTLNWAAIKKPTHTTQAELQILFLFLGNTY